MAREGEINMKKKITSMLALGLAAAMAVGITGCGINTSGVSSSGADADSLNIFVWTEYIPDSVIQNFEKETGIKVNVTTFSSNEDMLAKVKAEA